MAADAHDVGPCACSWRNGRQLMLMMLGPAPANGETEGN